MEQRTDVLQRAVEVFARGFCFTRSFTHPYLAERVGKVWVVRDAPRKHGGYRREEWIAHGVAPNKMDQVAREHTRGRFAMCPVCGVDESDEPLRAGFKSLDYRLGATEAVMVHELKRIPRFEKPVEVVAVTTTELAERLNKAAKSRQVLPEHLSKDSPLRQYVALVADKPVGWVRSIDVGHATWCSNMYVDPKFRRRGIARAMMSTMLRDDRTGGSKLAVLTASHAGAKLYPVVGYKQIGTLMLYTPKKK
jgi:GNAT superfamily N-acetyltransferase